jgi:hypothetical protein
VPELPFRRVIHSLSGAGAVRNAETVLRQRAQQQATVDAMTRRLHDVRHEPRRAS